MTRVRLFAFALAAAIALAAAGFGTSLAWARYTASLGPLDLAASREGSTVVVDRNGRLLRPFTLPDGRWRLPASTHEVDPRYLAMLVAYEDGRFYEHDGVDLRALVRAGAQWLMRGHVVSGGSTLTMQVARRLEPRPRTFGAKLIDTFRALQLEARFSKREILALYLTLAPYGGNLEGVRAASLAYFGHEPVSLTDSEQALLIALPQSPEARRPDRRPKIARTARAAVLQRLVAADAMTTAAAAGRRRATPCPIAPPSRRWPGRWRGSRRSGPRTRRPRWSPPSTPGCRPTWSGWPRPSPAPRGRTRLSPCW